MLRLNRGERVRRGDQVPQNLAEQHREVEGDPSNNGKPRIRLKEGAHLRVVHGLGEVIYMMHLEQWPV